MTDKLREAAQAALEAWSDGIGVHPRMGAALGRLRAALAEQTVKESLTVAEPVAWFYERAGGEEQGISFRSDNEPTKTWMPLYTHPPRREWRGLTKEERLGILDTTHPDSRWTLAERIEAALKEKNHEPR